MYILLDWPKLVADLNLFVWQQNTYYNETGDQI
jgi:hypothetical protein